MWRRLFTLPALQITVNRKGIMGILEVIISKGNPADRGGRSKEVA